MASTVYRGTVFAFRVSLLVNFMYFLLLPCVPQGVPVANKVSYLIFHITGIRNCLNATRLSPIIHYLMPVIQLYIFLAQWRLVLSESAVSPINVS